MIESNPRLVSM